MSRQAILSRKTKETDIVIAIDLDGSGKCDIDTGIGFFDHMLTALAVHGSLDLTVSVKGDLNVDCHHTIEDTGIVLGQAIKKALGDKIGIVRYGSFFAPMDEALGFCALDICDRPYLVFSASFTSDSIGGYDAQMVQEFFRAVAVNAGMTLHLKCEYGFNDHHIAEALHKAFAHALKEAVKIESGKLLSTKGVI